MPKSRATLNTELKLAISETLNYLKIRRRQMISFAHFPKVMAPLIKYNYSLELQLIREIRLLLISIYK